MTNTKHITTHSTTQTGYQIRKEQHNGREYIVVPVVMMVEGVHSGSAGPVLHLQENFSQNPQDWNGVPLTAGHPRNAHGEYIGAYQADPDHWIVGHVANTRVEDGKLKAEAWIDQQRAIAVNPEVVNYIKEGKKLDVSIGAFTEDQPKAGTHNDREYQAVTVNYIPDHLALLPGARGACSWQDGCGIRNNEDQSNKDNNMKNEQLQALKEDIKEGKGVVNGLQDNEVGFVELSSKLQSMLDRRDSETYAHFLEEVYDDYFIYRVSNRDNGDTNFYRQEYSVNEQEEIELQGDRSEVRKQVQFVPLQSNSEDEDCGCSGMKRTKFNNNKNHNNTVMSEKNNPSAEVMEKVVGLVNNERTRFTKSDRSWLLQLNEDQLNALEPIEAPAPEVTKEQAIQALSEELGDVDKLKGIVSDDVKSKIEIGLTAYEAEREKLINTIQTNTSKEDWPEDTLNGLEIDMLRRVAKSVRPTDYSGQGPVHTPQNNSNGGEEEVLLPVGVAK